MVKAIIKSIKISITSLLANKARSFLTMLGIIIGIGAVIIIMAVGASAQNLVLTQIKSLGTNLIGILPGHSEKESPLNAFTGFSVTTLTYDDAMALRDKKNVPNIVDVVAYNKSAGTAVWSLNSYDTNLSGITVGYLKVEGGEVKIGRFFTREEEKNFSRVAVLGSTVKKELFGESDVVGQRIKIKNQSFEVIGVMKERGIVAMQDYDDQIFLPIKTAQKLIGVNHLGLIRAKIDQKNNINRAINDVEATLRERHGITDTSGKSDDFTVRNAVQALDMITDVTNALKYFLAAMAALSLIVGGIGIMNIMLISVTERTREVGLRKAIGANNSNILNQFLMETVVITLLGGIIGILLGIAVSFLISSGIQFFGYDWVFIISPLSIFLAIAVSTIIGLVFGLYPAIKASKLSPIEALRYE